MLLPCLPADGALGAEPPPPSKVTGGGLRASCLADELTNPVLGSQIGTRNKWRLRRCDTRHHDNRCWCHAGDPRCFSLPRLQRGAGGRQSRAPGGPGQRVTHPIRSPPKAQAASPSADDVLSSSCFRDTYPCPRHGSCGTLCPGKLHPALARTTPMPQNPSAGSAKAETQREPRDRAKQHVENWGEQRLCPSSNKPACFLPPGNLPAWQGSAGCLTEVQSHGVPKTGKGRAGAC